MTIKFRLADHWLDLGILVVLVIVVWSAITSAILINQVHDTNDQIKRTQACQNAYNKAFATVVAQHETWANQDRAATTAMVHGLVTAKTDAQALAAFQNYLDVVQKNNQNRREHPLPTNDC